jgi:hypothetical protein
LPQLDSWRTGGLSDATPSPARDTFDWMATLYRSSPQYQRLSTRQKGNYEYGLRIVSNHALKANPRAMTRFGELRLTDISPGVVDKLYAAIKVDRETATDESGKALADSDGNAVVRETPRLRRGQEAMKACRRAWNVARRIEPTAVPNANPFEKAEVEAPKAGKTVPATWEQTLAFVKACDGADYWSIGTAAMVAYLWFQRQEHVVGVPREDGRVTGLLWADYRPKDNPDCVVIRHPKTDEAVALPLYSASGRPLFPELTERRRCPKTRCAHLHARQARRNGRPSPMADPLHHWSPGRIHSAGEDDHGDRRPPDRHDVPIVPAWRLHGGRRRRPFRRRCECGGREDRRHLGHLSQGHHGTAATCAHALARREIKAATFVHLRRVILSTRPAAAPVSH